MSTRPPKPSRTRATTPAEPGPTRHATPIHRRLPGPGQVHRDQLHEGPCQGPRTGPRHGQGGQERSCGTLDPLASGVLVIGIGRPATRLLSRIVGASKKYRTEIDLSGFTPSDDLESDVEPVSVETPPTRTSSSRRSVDSRATSCRPLLPSCRDQGRWQTRLPAGSRKQARFTPRETDQGSPSFIGGLPMAFRDRRHPLRQGFLRQISGEGTGQGTRDRRILPIDSKNGRRPVWTGACPNTFGVARFDRRGRSHRHRRYAVSPPEGHRCQGRRFLLRRPARRNRFLPPPLEQVNMWREKQRFVERNDGATGSPDIISQKTSSVSKFDRPICFIQKNLPYFILLSTDGQSRDPDNAGALLGK